MCLSCFDRALSMGDDTNLADVWYNLGQVAICIGDLGLAYQAYKIAISTDPNHAPSHNNIAVLEIRKGTMHAAKTMLGAARRLAPYMYEPHFNSALLAFRLGDYASAHDLVTKSLAAFPKHSDSKVLAEKLAKLFENTAA